MDAGTQTRPRAYPGAAAAMPPGRLRRRLARDRLARRGFLALTGVVLGLFLVLAAALAWRSAPVLRAQSLPRVLASADWMPQQGRFGLLAFVAGTALVTGAAIALAAPVSVLAAIHLSEYAPARLRRLLLPAVDLLSGIPSVVYGVWGMVAVVPLVGRLATRLGFYSTGYCILSAAAVLAVMVCPFIIHLSHEVLQSVPRGIREASLALGATRWQTVKRAVLRQAMPGITAAVVLGTARAMGETIAVLMVVGNVAEIPRSLFDPAYPIPALIANNYGEMMSIPLYDSALLLAAFVLLAMVVLFNVLARGVLGALRRGVA